MDTSSSSSKTSQRDKQELLPKPKKEERIKIEPLRSPEYG
jgi:hypothetical protein